MQITVFRHGIAERQSGDGTDASRQLTDEGVKKTRLAAKGLSKLIDEPSAIFTSPRLRARQTADILASQFQVEPQIVDDLGDQDLSPITELLSDRHDDALMLVGHEPTLGELVEWLCTGKVQFGFSPLKKAGCAVLETEAASNGSLGGRAELRFVATSKMLRLIGA